MKALIRTRMGSHDAHYGGNLVDGARMLQLFGDVATELCILADGDEGLFRAYDSIDFLKPVFAGDFIEAEGEIVGWGRTSLKMEFVARKVIAPRPDASPSAADFLVEPEIVCRAHGTCVIPSASKRPVLRGGRPGPCILTAAMVGAETTRAQNPHLPITAEEMGEEALRCVQAGAAVIHLHVRDKDGLASQETELFRAAIRAIRARTDVIIQTSTGGAVGMTADERCGPLRLSGADAPDMATLNVGSINFGDDIFTNPAPITDGIAQRIQQSGITPEIEVYDAGHVEIALELLRKGLIKAPLHFQFVLGVRGALAATARNLDFMIGSIPAGSTWGVAGVGRHEFPLAELSIIRGGNVRVGLEDNIYLSKGVLAEGSGPLVARAAELARAHGREIATVAQARQTLGLPTRK